MATLKIKGVHKWDKNEYSALAVSWPDPKNPGTGKVSVKLGDAAKSYSVPRAGIQIDKKEGSLTNNTDKTINYTPTRAK